MIITLIGHPYANIGMGELLRAAIRSFQAVHAEIEVIDAYSFLPKTDPDHRRLMKDIEVPVAKGQVRLFYINGDEVSPVLAHIEGHKLEFCGGYNIIMPAWELPAYPTVWAKELHRFDEVWAMSRFIQESLAQSDVASHYIGLSCEIPFRTFLPRRYFGIRESAFVFLNFFDVTSFPTRKNPGAILEFYRQLRARHPLYDVQLVMKIKGGDIASIEALAELRSKFPDIVLIEETLSTITLHSLIAACDCFLSLHRSEGFGRGPAEAMYVGRLALATGWSGNVDYMGADGSTSVHSKMVSVKPGDYPHSDGQHWAEPDIDHAVNIASQLIDNPTFRFATAEAGMRHVHQYFSNRAVGLRSLQRLSAIDLTQRVV